MVIQYCTLVVPLLLHYLVQLKQQTILSISLLPALFSAAGLIRATIFIYFSGSMVSIWWRTSGTIWIV